LVFRGVDLADPSRGWTATDLVRELRDHRDPEVMRRLEKGMESGEVGIKLLDGLPVTGVTFDRWTRGNQPAALWVENALDEPGILRLDLAVGADGQPLEHSVRVRVDREGERNEYVFERAGSRQVLVGPLAARQKHWIVVGVDRAWQAPPPDGRWLGVNLRLVQLVPSGDGATPPAATRGRPPGG
jgi:hypothetical protein